MNISALSSWIDFDLVCDAAEELAEVDFILVGPFCPKTKTYLKNKPKNVHTLGTKKYAQIHSCVDLFDVGIIPFKSGPISEAISPVKSYGYFALGTRRRDSLESAEKYADPY